MAHTKTIASQVKADLAKMTADETIKFIKIPSNAGKEFAEMLIEMDPVYHKNFIKTLRYLRGRYEEDLIRAYHAVSDEEVLRVINLIKHKEQGEL